MYLIFFFFFFSFQYFFFCCGKWKFYSKFELTTWWKTLTIFYRNLQNAFSIFKFKFNGSLYLQFIFIIDFINYFWFDVILIWAYSQNTHFLILGESGVKKTTVKSYRYGQSSTVKILYKFPMSNNFSIPSSSHTNQNK